MKKAYTGNSAALSSLLVWFCLCACILLQIRTPPIPSGDGFLEISRTAFFSPQFFAADRPFSVPLLYKACLSDPSIIVAVQKIFLASSWVLLGWAFSLPLKNTGLRILSCTIIPCAALWWNLLGWTSVLRSESFAFSLFAVLLSALIVFLRKPSPWTVLAAAGASVLFSFTKDNHPWFLFFVIGVILLGSRILQDKILMKGERFAKILLLIILLTLAAQTVSAQVAKRQQFCLINVLLQRIFANQQYTNWFIERGMPAEGDILTWKGQWASSYNYSLYTERYDRFMQWIETRGTTAYIFFLATHPGYAFRPLLDELSVLFCYNLDLYTSHPPPQRIFQIPHAILPLSSLPAAAALAALCLFASIRRKSILHAVPAILFVGFCFNALFVYHADAMEVPRHCLMNRIGLECLSQMALLLLADSLVEGAQHGTVKESPGEINR